MPELPEVETIRRQLAAEIVGRRFERVIARASSLFRTPARVVAASLRGARLARVERRGKVLALALDSDRALLVHLGMSGQVLIVPPAVAEATHRHLELALDDGRTLVFRDPRRFGFLKIVPAGGLNGERELKGVGTDPLDPALTWERFRQVVAERAAAVKPLLMSQAPFAGIGNVYADEILHAARVRPTRTGAGLSLVELKELYHAMRDVLAAAIEHGGTSFDEAFTDCYGRPGLYGGRLLVYGRAGEPCPRCHGALRAAAIGGRGSVFCPACQK